MAFFLKKLLLELTVVQGILLRASAWLIREKYSGINPDLFSRLVQSLSVFQEHGGELKRYGSQFDGGYVLLGLETRCSKMISFGVGDNWDFEKSLSNYVQEIDLYDHTIQAPVLDIANAKFFRIGLSDVPGHGFTDLFSVTSNNLNDMILKIDIEGDEWKSLASIDSELLKKYAQIVIELHDLHKINFDETLKSYVSVLDALHLNHELVFTHANNWSPFMIISGYLIPDVIEVTFVRRDLLIHGSQNKKSLDKLHAPNNPKAAHIQLNF